MHTKLFLMSKAGKKKKRKLEGKQNTKANCFANTNFLFYVQFCFYSQFELSFLCYNHEIETGEKIEMEKGTRKTLNASFHHAGNACDK